MKTETKHAPLDEIVSISGNVRALCGNTLANELLDVVSLARTQQAELLEERDALLAALCKLSAAAQLIRSGERNGYVFGKLSQMDDEARALIAKVGGAS